MNRLPSKEKFVKRGVIQMDNNECVLCSSVEDTCVHLFLQCRENKKIWGEIGKWIGFQGME